MRSISFHVPQAKEQILYTSKFDPASPRAPNDRYSNLMVEFWRAPEVHGLLSLSRAVQRFLVEKKMWVLSFPANCSPEFKTHARSWIENVKPGNRILLFRNNRVPGYYEKVLTWYPVFIFP